MGRKANYSEKPKKGPGRKARKQEDPNLKIVPVITAKDLDNPKKLSSNQVFISFCQLILIKLISIS
jgi:hypothetical protein